jgi:hypothetical protein
VSKKTAISLGNECGSAQYGVTHKLRPTREDGYKTCPFDLMVTNVDGIIECLNTDFRDFCNPNFLKVKQRPEVPDHIILHEKYKFEFNHESPYHADLHVHQNWPTPFHFVNDNFKYFIERYEKRVSNFRFYCESGYYVTFILQAFSGPSFSDELMNRLHAAIKNRYPNLKYKIINI